MGDRDPIDAAATGVAGRQALEESASDSKRQLDSVLATLDTFSYAIAHDLRSPLRAIDNFSRILFEEYGTALDEEGHRLLGVVRRNAAKMADLIDALLVFDRIGRRNLEFVDIDLDALARDVAAELAPTFAERRVALEIRSLPHVRGDLAGLRRVLSCMLSNAIKFTRSRDSAQIRIQGQLSGDDAVCSVSDNGVGFEPEYQHKLFGICQRLHDAEEFEGSGMALGIAKRIIEMHGGRVWAQGAPGVGATFCFSLPHPRQQTNA